MTAETGVIITHPGSAHFDEVTAISLVLAVHENTAFKIERRLPDQAELDDPETWVIDTGRRYEPERHNFDHHQDRDLSASFVLLARHLVLEETLAVMPWWRFKDDVDRIGPARSARIHNGGDDLVNRNQMEAWLLDEFAADPGRCAPQLRSFGAHLIRESRKLKEQIDFWKTRRRLVIAGVLAVIGETRESAGLEEFRRLDDHPPDIVISLDRWGEGWRLFRFEGAPVDFFRISAEPEIEFAHNSGFMAKTRDRLSLPELIALVGKAVIVPEHNVK